MTVYQHIKSIESMLSTIGDDSKENLKAQRQTLRDSIQRISGMETDGTLSLTNTIKTATDSCKPDRQRAFASILIRIVSSSSVLDDQEIWECRRDVVAFIESNCPDMTKGLLDEDAQTHEKLESVQSIHHRTCERLKSLRNPTPSLHALAGQRQEIMSCINNQLTKAYLNPFEFNDIRSSIASLLSQVDSLLESTSYIKQTIMHQLIADIDALISTYVDEPTFVVQGYFLPFLRELRDMSHSMNAKLIDDFACQIEVPEGSRKPEKRFPLHLVGTEIEILIPLNNTGPGVAQDVSVVCIAEHCEVQSEDRYLGSVNPGQFVFALVIKVTEVQTELDVEVEVVWNVVGESKSHRILFTVQIKGQRTDVNWNQLALDQPYSLEVAYRGDFYGRKDVLGRIVGRLSSDEMQSCYITGQKRVGKSSLAHAVQSQLESMQSSSHYHVLYIETGEFLHSTGEATLNELGLRLEGFIQSRLAHQSDWQSPGDYSSSLSPLSRLLDKLGRENEHQRFIVMLDEFDEINEELYVFGELANTLFQNIRHLASKKNLAFVLIGSERMPFLMASQGEKLNKFSPESLDSFHKDTEWHDYVSLVRDPVKDSITFLQEAIRRLYDLTNGHPYFTKALCSQVYELAVETKDAEISEAEVTESARRLLRSLDTNAFAHYWRDGIRGDSKNREIVAARRCRLLVSWARSRRLSSRTTIENIVANDRLNMHVDDVTRDLTDFCRRGVFYEDEEEYLPNVEIFGDWLRELGFSQLTSSELADEFADIQRQEEDNAYIESDEVQRLISSWRLYQGGEITSDRVRSWINQVGSNVERRMLFKLLANLRFVTELEAREMFLIAFASISQRFSGAITRTKSDRTRDVFVTFVDESAKSGSYFAGVYARSNKIYAANVVSPDQLEKRLAALGVDDQAGVVVVDDLIGTGGTLIHNLQRNKSLFQSVGIGDRFPLSVVVLCATKEGGTRVRRYLKDEFVDGDLEICETLDDAYFAFGAGTGFWDSQEEKDKARTLVTEIGARIQKRNPLGYQGQGLLISFWRNCPNNSLPILHGYGRGPDSWTPLFPRESF